MSSPYSDFVGKIWDHFEFMDELHYSENMDVPQGSLEDLLKNQYHNFVTHRKPLYHLSKMIEKYAESNGVPLVATFEKEARFNFVERRYYEMIDKIPKICVVADFGKTDFHLSPKINVLNCKNTELINVWSVIARGPEGPFGLISEEFQDGRFRGFFTSNADVCAHAIETMEDILKSKIEI